MRLKRALACALTLALLCGNALADTAVNGDAFAALIAADGTEIVPEGIYARIEPLKDGFWCGVDGEGRYALLNAAGEALSEERFDELRCTAETILFRQGESWGILGDDGSVLVQARYSDIRANGEGDFVALRNSAGTATAQNVDYLDATGNETAIGVRVLYGLSDFSEGYMPVLLARTGRYGYLDTQGVVAFGGEYIAAGGFQDGYAVVYTENGAGMINQVGRLVVPAEYREILRVGELALLTRRDGGVLVLRIGGEVLLELEGEAYVGRVGDMGLIWQASGLTVLNGAGEVAFTLPAEAKLAAGLSGQMIVTNGLWGEAASRLVQPDGSEVGDTYQSIQPLSEDADGAYYAVGRFDARAVQDASGNVLYYDWSPDGIRYALMDGTGTLLSDFVFDCLRPAEAGRFYAVTAEKAGLIDSTGKFVWETANS